MNHTLLSQQGPKTFTFSNKQEVAFRLPYLAEHVNNPDADILSRILYSDTKLGCQYNGYRNTIARNVYNALYKYPRYKGFMDKVMPKGWKNQIDDATKKTDQDIREEMVQASLNIIYDYVPPYESFYRYDGKTTDSTHDIVIADRTLSLYPYPEIVRSLCRTGTKLVIVEYDVQDLYNDLFINYVIYRDFTRVAHYKNYREWLSIFKGMGFKLISMKWLESDSYLYEITLEFIR